MTNPSASDDAIRPCCFASLMVSKPLHFTLKGTLLEVLALLEGYEAGAKYGRTGPVADDSPSYVLKEFWSRVDVGETAAGSTESTKDAYQRVLKHFGTEDSALKALVEIARTFDPSMR